MRIELSPNDAVIIAQAFRGNGPSGIRYTLMTQRAIRHFHDFEELVKALKDHYQVRQEPA